MIERSQTMKSWIKEIRAAEEPSMQEDKSKWVDQEELAARQAGGTEAAEEKKQGDEVVEEEKGELKSMF